MSALKHEEALFRLTADELTRIDRCFPTYKRDLRKRVYVCDCAEAQKQVFGQLPVRADLCGVEQPHTEVRVDPRPDGSCPYCGYHTKIAVLHPSHETKTVRRGRKPNQLKEST
jgi:hypothetical protein